MRIEATTGVMGAIVTDLALNHPQHDSTINELLEAWYRYQILVFPRQKLSLDQLQAFVGQLGDFGEDPFIAPLSSHPHILELRREADETAVNFGGSWHSDWSFQRQPPSATILHAQTVPPIGGDTLFANSYAAFEALPADRQEYLGTLQAVHSAIGPYGPKGFYASEKEDRSIKILPSDAAKATFSHPMVRTHPGSGRKALYINKVYTVGIEGMTPDGAASLLEELFVHSVQEQFVYRQQWQDDMLVMWDNRCTQHLALGGYDGYQRVMHRMTLKGETPV